MGTNVFLDLHVIPGDDSTESTLWTVSDDGWMRVEFTLPPNTFTADAQTEALMVAERYAQSYENVKGATWHDSRIYVHRAPSTGRGYSYRVGESSALMRDINGANFLHSY